MRFSEILAASSLVAPFVVAHDDHIPGMPKIFGLGSGVKRSDFVGPAARRAAQPPKNHKFNKRQGGADGRCGPQGGGASCDAGYCCSSAGWCGNEEEYCQAPDCLIDYGPACDANSVPNGQSTRNIARPQLGNVAYGGEGVYPCVTPGTVAITYDDGPYIYTNDVIDQFNAYGFKATFFITGINNGKGAIDDAATQWPAVISRMFNEGHQVASHTWSHQDLSAITKEQRINQMVYNEMAIRNIIQKFPTYMRPPYSSCTAASGCQSDLADLGYVVTYFNLDTDDYNNVTPDKIQNAKDNFFKAVNPSDPATQEFLVIGHDIHQQTAQNLTGYMLDLLNKKGYKGVTVGECLGDPEANWYRDSAGTIVSSTSAIPSATKSSSSTSAPTATPTASSPDGSCGGSTGYTCIGFELGSCCSQYGYCGSTTDHCGTGCNPLFGTCGSSSSASSAVPAPSSTSAAPPSSPTGPTSTDGSCGGTNGYSCIGFVDGECCSQYGYCGATTDHCGTGCNPLYGNCGGSSNGSSSSTTPAPTSTPTKPVTSTDGSCAGDKGFTCVGFADGECCSQYGWCGSSSDHCGTGCNPAFGNCGNVSASSVVSISSSPIPTSEVVSSTPAVSVSSANSSVTSSEVISSKTISSDVVSYTEVSASADSSTYQASSTPANPSNASSIPAISSSSSTPASPSNVSSTPAVSSSLSSRPASPSSVSSTPVTPSSPSSTPLASSASSSSPATSQPSSYVDVTSSSRTSSTPSTPAASSSVPISSSPVVSSSPSTPKASSSLQGSTLVRSSTAAPSIITTSVRASPDSTPSSTSCATSASPKATENVSKTGKCGPKHNGVTCKGYSDRWGRKEECCSRDGTCGNNMFACGWGCQERHGKCWW